LVGHISQRDGGNLLIHDGFAGGTNLAPPRNRSAFNIFAPTSSAMRWPSPVLVGFTGAVSATAADINSRFMAGFAL
jgi:hypothetical protein